MDPIKLNDAELESITNATEMVQRASQKQQSLIASVLASRGLPVTTKVEKLEGNELHLEQAPQGETEPATE